jgi:hypothetical protein
LPSFGQKNVVDDLLIDVQGSLVGYEFFFLKDHELDWMLDSRRSLALAVQR